MKIFNLPTPNFVVDLDIMEENLNEIQKICDDNNVELWPMIKTHKSTEIAEMQIERGAKGFLVGTIDEAEKLSEKFDASICIAYPLCGVENIERMIKISQKSRLIMSIDNLSTAEEVNDMLNQYDLKMDYVIIIDSGLHRLGVKPEMAGVFINEMKKFDNLNFVGISTHPGHVYGASGADDIQRCADEEIEKVLIAKENISKEGYEVSMVASGSTPTFFKSVKSDVINVQRPGNYVYYDCIQIGLGVVDEDKCSLTVLATVISDSQPNQLILDAGSKCLGLDTGAHGIALTKGYGIVKGHPELEIVGLSEEVAKVKIDGETSLKVGDQVQIIPNHSCSSANMTNNLIGYRNGVVEKAIKVDIRGGSRAVEF